MSKLSPFPFIETIEDLQEILVELSPIVCKDWIGIREPPFIEVKRKFFLVESYDGDFTAELLSDYTLESWLAYEDDQDFQIIYTLNYEEFAKCLDWEQIHDHFDFWLEKAGEGLKRLETKLHEATTGAIVKNELLKVLNEYSYWEDRLSYFIAKYQKRNNPSEIIALDFASEIVFHCFMHHRERLKSEFPLYADFFDKAQRSNEPDNPSSPTSAGKGIISESTDIQVEAKETEAKENVTRVLKEIGLLDSFKDRFIDKTDEALLFLAKRHTSDLQKELYVLHKEKVPSTRYFCLCYFFGIVSDIGNGKSNIIGSSPKEKVGTGLRMLYNANQLKDETEITKENASSSFANNFALLDNLDHKNNPFKSKDNRLLGTKLKDFFPSNVTLEAPPRK